MDFEAMGEVIFRGQASVENGTLKLILLFQEIL